jgi:regulator of protease activity HflC (stomatin/prohibitin superfamily)
MKKNLYVIALLALSATACTRIPTGEVGLRVNFDKTIDDKELVAGSFNQVLVGDVLKFPVKEIAATVNDLTPLAADNSTMKDFDVAIIYNLNPNSIAELYTKKSHSFHAISPEGETLLMYSYLQLTARNAVYKEARKYPALEMNDKRGQIESDILQTMKATLAAEGLSNDIVISQVQVKSISPSDAVRQSADALVKAQNEKKQKAVEVETAKLEAERIAALNANSGAINYMQAQAQMRIAEGIANGKVQTVVIPYDFKGMVNIGAAAK